MHNSSTISSNAQYVTLQIYFSHPSLVFFSFFATPPIKLKLGQQIGGGGGGGPTNSKLPGPIIIMMGQLVVRSYLLHSFLQVHSVAAPFTSHRKVCNDAEPKPFC